MATVAPVAMQEAWLAADNIIHLCKGETQLHNFKYVDHGAMATIGRCQAVVIGALCRLAASWHG